MTSALPGALVDLLRAVAADQRVTAATMPSDSWMLHEGELRHRAADYFRLIGRRDDRGREHLLFEQSEEALVGLVVTGPPGERMLLLNARAEPGLHGGAQFSTTVQSTPSNYERRHGGGETPYLAEASGTAEHGRTLHESRQYDWGDEYLAKVKLLRIVEVPGVRPVEPPLAWVRETELNQLLAGDRLTTVDLRAAALALRAHDAGARRARGGPRPRRREPVLEPVALEELRRWRITPEGIHDNENERSVVWVSTESGTREVARWTQPLLALRDDRVIDLAVRERGGAPQVAVRWGTQLGLDGLDVLLPAPVSHTGTPSSEVVRLSAEGGRFLRHGVTVRIVRSPATIDGEWMPLPIALEHALADRRTSIELRLGIEHLLRAGGMSPPSTVVLTDPNSSNKEAPR